MYYSRLSSPFLCFFYSFIFCSYTFVSYSELFIYFSTSEDGPKKGPKRQIKKIYQILISTLITVLGSFSPFLLINFIRYLDYTNSLLNYFVKTYTILYGKDNCSIN